MKTFWKKISWLFDIRGSLWRAMVFVALPIVVFAIGSFAFNPADAMGRSILRFVLSFFYPMDQLPRGSGFGFVIVALLVLGTWLTYEARNNRYFLYNLNRVNWVGFLFPAPKTFQFEPCVYWFTPTIKHYGAYRGEVKEEDGTVSAVVVGVNAPPNPFGQPISIDKRYVIRITMSPGKLLSMVTTGGTILPSTKDHKVIPWPGETKEDAQKRYRACPA